MVLKEEYNNGGEKIEKIYQASSGHLVIGKEIVFCERLMADRKYEKGV